MNPEECIKHFYANIFRLKNTETRTEEINCKLDIYRDLREQTKNWEGNHFATRKSNRHWVTQNGEGKSKWYTNRSLEILLQRPLEILKSNATVGLMDIDGRKKKTHPKFGLAIALH